MIDDELYKFLRRKHYQGINKEAFPKRKSGVKDVLPDHYYVVWEKNLLSPKIVRLHFASEYAALKYAINNILDGRFNVLAGPELIKHGLLRALTRIKRHSGKQHKYYFNPDLPKQRQKTLRTLNRRNARRNARKLLYLNKAKMADKFILDKIKEKPGVFFKKLRLKWDYPLTFSVTFKSLYVEEEGWVVSDILEASKQMPNTANQLMNIYLTLKENYPDEKYDYKNETYVTATIKLYRKYIKRFGVYLEKKKPIKFTTESEFIWKELIARGFVDINLPEFVHFRDNQDDNFHIAANIANLIFPRRFDSPESAATFNTNFGIKGYTYVTS